LIRVIRRISKLSCTEELDKIDTLEALNYMLYRIKGTQVVRRIIPILPRQAELPFKLPFKRPFWRKRHPFGKYVIQIDKEYFLLHSQELNLDKVKPDDEDTWPAELKNSPSWRHLVYCTEKMEGAYFVIELYKERDAWKDLETPPSPPAEPYFGELYVYIVLFYSAMKEKLGLSDEFGEIFISGLGPWPPPDTTG
jgi:hypothetical protein